MKFFFAPFAKMLCYFPPTLNEGSEKSFLVFDYIVVYKTLGNIFILIVSDKQKLVLEI
jgi:hypothetical protein